ncbi:hypothetical protein Pla110_35420 [Polystyrenella longa]|uniref:General secretion pathway protein I n=1 Tax=Polystyrenella longa TaxID=2528007 RepID=A0A518CRD9_9PLAN|nr:hypothetical protein [Polystyrenella longa]QDU81792.1 hypothetical protein Pla110_35420 [Polystyrenella longa]
MKRTEVRMQNTRGGFSLMEVLIASSILIGSLVVLDQLANLGRISARSSESMVTAQLFCEQKMNLMLSGMEAMESTDDTVWEDNEDWHYAVETEPDEKLPLTKLTIRVWQDEEKFLRPQRFQLVRWIMSTSSSESGDGEEITDSYLSELDN